MTRKLLFVFVSVFLFTFSNAQSQTVASNKNGITRPKLIIGLVVDQMRWDYLYRYYERYGTGGFKRLLQKGFSFENTFIPYNSSVTSAGHATLYTGSVPAFHGIVGNDWMENGTQMYCAGDLSVQSIGTTSLQGQMSPRNMFSTTIGDELRIATNFRSRVFGIAMKDRGAIFPAGHSANAAYWFDDTNGHWITSTYYMNGLPGWVSQYNSLKKTDSMMRTNWNLLYDSSGYTQSTSDDKPWERPLVQETKRTFPHSYESLIGKNYLAFRTSPFGNTLTLDFAMSLIENEKLGRNQTDMLCISLSSTDYVGHNFGPNALEVEDMYLRLDKDIEKFLVYLDRRIGTNNYVLFLSADHGAPNSVGFMQANKLPGGTLRSYPMAAEINKVLSPKYKADSLVKIMSYQVYLNNKRIDSLQLNVDDIKKDITAFLYSKSEVTHVIDYNAFDKTVLPSRVKEMFAKGYFPKRSGDIQFFYKSQYTYVQSTGTDHGTWYTYDTHIPLIWYGWKIPSGSTSREVYMTDVAPTLSALLHIQMPGASIGNVLPEIIQPVNKK